MRLTIADLISRTGIRAEAEPGARAPAPQRVQVQFLTPGRFHHQPERKGQAAPPQRTGSKQPEWYVGQPGAPSQRLEFHILLRALLTRISLLMYFHCGQKLQLDFKASLERAREVAIAEDRLRWVDLARYSSRQERWVKLGGLIGRISFAGHLEPFLPYLLLGEQLHVGKGTAFGLGQMRLELG